MTDAPKLQLDLTAFQPAATRHSAYLERTEVLERRAGMSPEEIKQDQRRERHKRNNARYAKRNERDVS